MEGVMRERSKRENGVKDQLVVLLRHTMEVLPPDLLRILALRSILPVRPDPSKE